MLTRLFSRVRQTARRRARAADRHLVVATIPVASQQLSRTLADLVRSKPALIAENNLLPQQIIMLRRSVGWLGEGGHPSPPACKTGRE